MAITDRVAALGAFAMRAAARDFLSLLPPDSPRDVQSCKTPSASSSRPPRKRSRDLDVSCAFVFGISHGFYVDLFVITIGRVLLYLYAVDAAQFRDSRSAVYSTAPRRSFFNRDRDLDRLAHGDL